MSSNPIAKNNNRLGNRALPGGVEDNGAVGAGVIPNSLHPVISIEPKLYPGIDYDFRPFYWTPAANPLEAALRNVKGRQRREMVREYYAVGHLEGLSDNLLNDSLDDMARERLSRIHPSFMGGEYLADYGRNEVEIVRIELQSTTYDVISLRARPTGSRVAYSLVDEYDSKFMLPQQTSRRPFSLRQLIRFLDFIQPVGVDDPGWNRFGFVLSFNQCNLECGANLEDLHNFTRVYSDQYPDLASHCSQKVADWYSSSASSASQASG
jgi:hypothetical protein